MLYNLYSYISTYTFMYTHPQNVAVFLVKIIYALVFNSCGHIDTWHLCPMSMWCCLIGKWQISLWMLWSFCCSLPYPILTSSSCYFWLSSFELPCNLETGYWLSSNYLAYPSSWCWPWVLFLSSLVLLFPMVSLCFIFLVVVNLCLRCELQKPMIKFVVHSIPLEVLGRF